MAQTFDWAEFALCKGGNGALFFPELGTSTAAAKALCFQCPVQQPCLYQAVRTRERHGIWGGMAEHERRAMFYRLEDDS